MSFALEIAIAAAALSLFIFVPTLRRIVSTVVGFCVATLAIAVAIGGTALLMNNVSIYESPGPRARIKRFLTLDWAATSDKGLGSAECAFGWPSGSKEPAGGAVANVAKAEPGARLREEGKGKSERRASGKTAAKTTATPTPTAAAEEEDSYPELVRRSYPGISRAKLYGLAQDVLGELGGWKIVKSNPRSHTIDCVYATRIFRWQDHVRIVITPKGEIDLCSRSRVGEPESGSWLRIFPGDFGANIGHIKEFYQALEPKVDAVYKEDERRMNTGQR